MSEFDIRVVDYAEFMELGNTLPAVQAYERGRDINATGRQADLGAAAARELHEQFTYLLSCRCQDTAYSIAGRVGLDPPAFVCGIGLRQGRPELAGFLCIKHSGADNLAPGLVEYMKSVGNRDIEALGYDYSAATSVARHSQGHGLATRMREVATDTVVLRHRRRGGSGPALARLTSLSRMGSQRVLASAQRIAAARDDVVLGYGDNDIGRLGLYMALPELCSVCVPA